MIKIKVHYPWGDRYLNYEKIRIVEINETTGNIYYSAEVSQKTYEEKKGCYSSLQDMAEQYLHYQCYNEQNARKTITNPKDFISYNTNCFSYYSTINGQRCKITRYTFMDLDYNHPYAEE